MVAPLAMGFRLLFLQGQLAFSTQPGEGPVRVKDLEAGFGPPVGFVLGLVELFRVTSSAAGGGFLLTK